MWVRSLRAVDLYPFQEEDSDRIRSQYATLYSVPQGGGKTYTIAESMYRDRDKNKSILVVAPKNTFRTWIKAVRRQWRGEQVSFKRIGIDAGAEADLFAGVPGWYIISWQLMARKPHGHFDKLKVDVVVLDESHRMQNRKSRSWGNIKHVTPRNHKIAMSGTFAGNKLEGAYTTLRWLAPEKNGMFGTPLSFWNWAYDWLIVEQNEWLGFTEVKGERFENGTMLSYYDCYIRREQSELRELPVVTEYEVEFKLSRDERRVYKQMEEEAIAYLPRSSGSGSEGLVARVPMNVRQRLRTFALGLPVIQSDGTLTFRADMKSSRTEAIIDTLNDLDPDETGGVLIMTHSRPYAETLAGVLTANGFESYAWVGGTSQAVRDEVVADFGAGKRYRVIVAVIEAIAEGTDGLQEYCWTEFWASESENMYMNGQGRKRVHRDGQEHSVARYRFIAENTYDAGIIGKHTIRQADLDESYNAGRLTND